ncbi:MAG: hypothetical protein LiPW41_99 [Parcubacteria group bacterium LiPW_41]|nr:MAG: hypothetical protein LiPW41_99 [Parcubacteria group bacterium LiPW_41]
MRFSLTNIISSVFVFLCWFVVLFDFKEARKAHHKKKLDKIIYKYLDKETNSETFDQDIKKVFRLFSLYIENKKNTQEKHLRYLNLGLNEGRIRQAYAITGLGVALEREKIEKSAKICGINLCV